MAYEPTQWRSGDTITSERLNKMEQGIAGGGSGEVYALHTTRTKTPAENDGGEPTVTFSSVELREDGLPMWLIIDNDIDVNNITHASVAGLDGYDNGFFSYNNGLSVDRSTGAVGNATSSGGSQ